MNFAQKTPMIVQRLLWIAALVCGLMLASSCGDSSDSDTTETDTSNGTTDNQPCLDDLGCALGQFCIDSICQAPGEDCLANSDCEQVEQCRAGFCIPREDACTSDDACPEGQICEEASCRPGCRQDSECNDDQLCSPSTMRCISRPPECPDTCPAHQTCDDPESGCVPDGTCTTDGDCVGDDVCNAGTCGAPIITCERNDDCPDRQFCDRDIGECLDGCRSSGDCRAEEICIDNQCSMGDPPACDGDGFEPNDLSDAAVSISSGDDLSGLTYCNDRDWFEFRAFEGDMIEIKIDFVNDDGDLNLRVFKPNDEVLQLVGGQEDSETVRRTVNDTGVYTVEVFGANRDTYTTYDMLFERVRNCPEDDNEEDDTPQEATVVDPTAGPLENQFICGDDDDWYAVALFVGEQLDISLDFDSRDGDLSLELYDVTGEMLLDSSETEGDQEQISWTADIDSVFLIRVPGVDELINSYNLTTTLTLPDCEDDANEPNENAEEATALASGEPFEGTICSGDEDWYRITVPADIEVLIEATFDNAVGNLSLEMYDATGTELLQTEDSDTDNETLMFAAPLPGTFMLRVSGFGRTQNSYMLEATFAGASSCPDDDDFEDNDDFDSAASITTGNSPGLVLCNDDTADWYTFELTEGQSAEVFTLAAADLGNLDLTLYGPDATTDADTAVHDAIGEGVVKRVRVQSGVPAGTYRVRVEASEGEDIVYSLRHRIYDGLLPLDCEFDDPLEPNDSPAEADTLPPNQTAEGIVCGANTDWFRLDVVAGERVNIRADFLHANGNVDLTLRDTTGMTTLASATSETDNELITILAEATETLFLEVVLVDGAEGTGSPYALTISRIPGEAERNCTTDDPYEQNDDIDNPAAVEPGNYTATRCSGDDDYYSVAVAPGQTMMATLLHTGDAEDLALALYSGGAELTTATSIGDQPALRVVWDSSLNENLVLGVTSEQGGEIFYTLLIEVFDQERAFCGTPDALEPNTNPNEALSLDEPTDFENLGLCGADEDWFRIDIPAEMQLVVEAMFDAEVGNIDLFAYDDSGQGLAASTSTTGLERLIVPGGDEEPRTVMIRARQADPTNSEDARYDISMSIEELNIGGGACFEDAFEPNDAPLTVPNISIGSFDDLALCQDDVDDWFSIAAMPFQTVSVSIEYDPNNADFDVTGFDALLMIPAQSMGAPGTRTVDILNLDFFGGPVSIRVFNNDPETGGAYSMSVSVF